jgi:hypothetical protein
VDRIRDVRALVPFIATRAYLRQIVVGAHVGGEKWIMTTHPSMLGEVVDETMTEKHGAYRGRKRVIQRRFNVSVPRARVPEKASTRRDRFER